MSRIARCVTIDQDVYKKAQARNINISDAAEQGIRSRLNMEQVKEEVKKETKRYSRQIKDLLEIISDEDLAKIREAITRNVEFSKGWQRILKDKYGVTVSRTEIIKVFGPKK